MSESARLLFEEKDKTILELKKRLCKLEEKLETKDSDIIKLKVELAGVKAILNEWNKQVGGIQSTNRWMEAKRTRVAKNVWAGL